MTRAESQLPRYAPLRSRRLPRQRSKDGDALLEGQPCPLHLHDTRQVEGEAGET